MWYSNENSGIEKPGAVDSVSSKVYAYIRKDFEEIPESGSGEEVIPAHWRWQEMKIPKSALAIWQSAQSNSDALDDVYAALTELAELIEEG